MLLWLREGEATPDRAYDPQRGVEEGETSVRDMTSREVRQTYPDHGLLVRAGWRASLWAMRVMFFVMPRGDARNRLGELTKVWTAECREQWSKRYGVNT